jgi:hypothetical protein
MSWRITTEIIKQIHVVANQLPVLPNEKQGTRKVKGIDLINQGHLEVMLNKVVVPVELANTYDVPFIEMETVNHVDNLRQAYMNGGMLAVHLYIMNTAAHHEAMRAKYPHCFDEAGKYKGNEPSNN